VFTLLPIICTEELKFISYILYGRNPTVHSGIGGNGIVLQTRPAKSDGHDPRWDAFVLPRPAEGYQMAFRACHFNSFLRDISGGMWWRGCADHRSNSAEQTRYCISLRFVGSAALGVALFPYMCLCWQCQEDVYGAGCSEAALESKVFTKPTRPKTDCLETISVG
jgi:hypothetical protein